MLLRVVGHCTLDQAGACSEVRMGSPLNCTDTAQEHSLRAVSLHPLWKEVCGTGAGHGNTLHAEGARRSAGSHRVVRYWPIVLPEQHITVLPFPSSEPGIYCSLNSAQQTS